MSERENGECAKGEKSVREKGSGRERAEEQEETEMVALENIYSESD